MFRLMMAAQTILCCAALAGAAEAENPYKSAKVGDWVEFKSPNRKITVSKKTDQEVTLIEVCVSEHDGFERKSARVIDLSKPYDPLSPCIQYKQISPKPSKLGDTGGSTYKVIGEGQEKLTIGGKTLNTKWRITDSTHPSKFESPRTYRNKLWISSEVPLDGVVKHENTMVVGPCPGTGGTEVLTAFGFGDGASTEQTIEYAPKYKFENKTLFGQVTMPAGLKEPETAVLEVLWPCHAGNLSVKLLASGDCVKKITELKDSLALLTGTLTNAGMTVSSVKTKHDPLGNVWLHGKVTMPPGLKAPVVAVLENSDPAINVNLLADNKLKPLVHLSNFKDKMAAVCGTLTDAGLTVELCRDGEKYEQ